MIQSSLDRFRTGWQTLLIGVVLVGMTVPGRTAGDEGVQIKEADGKLLIQLDGQPFTEYHYRGGSRPFLYPIFGPDQVPMTRNWPMREVPGEEKDHPHHRSLWWAHGEVNGVDFWSESARAGTTIHDRFLEVTSGPNAGTVRTANKLIAKDGKLIATDVRTLRFSRQGDCRIIDFEVAIRASEGELKFGDTKEGTMALRLNEALRLIRDKKPGTGHIVNSEGIRDGETWGKRARWVDYFGPVDGKTVGVAIFDHPANPRYPTHWHVRDYGLFAANPFGIHDFEKKPAGTGNLVVPAGQTLTFRYRLFFHRGDEKAARIDERCAEYTAAAK
jgi:hypothetical protein